MSNKKSQNEILLKHIINEMPDVFILKDYKGDFLLCNETVATLYNTTPDEMIGKHDDDFGVPKEMADFFRQNSLDVIAKGKTEIVYEDTVDAKTGETRHFKSIKKPVKDLEGKDQLIILAQDITELVEHQKRTEESESRLQKVLEVIQEGVWDWRIPTGQVIHNDEWFRQLDLEKKTNSSLDDFKHCVHPDDIENVYARLDELLSGKKQVYESEHRMLKSDGSFIYVRDRGVIADYDSDGNPIRVVGSFKNITNEKLAEEKLIEAKNKAEEASEAKSVFLSNISHEFRTPLNGILGFAQMLQRNKNNNLGEKELKWADQIINSGTLLLNLVNEVLDLAIIETGQSEYFAEGFHPNSIFQECSSIIQHSIKEREISFAHVIESNKKVHVDRKKLFQVLINLLENATKYNRHQGSIILTYKDYGADHVQIIIEDTGQGIPKQELSMIFEPFYRVSEHANIVDGTGIGLSIVKKCMELMESDIKVESTFGQGTCFILTLPVYHGDS